MSNMIQEVEQLKVALEELLQATHELETQTQAEGDPAAMERAGRRLQEATHGLEEARKAFVSTMNQFQALDRLAGDTASVSHLQQRLEQLMDGDTPSGTPQD